MTEQTDKTWQMSDFDCDAYEDEGGAVAYVALASSPLSQQLLSLLIEAFD